MFNVHAESFVKYSNQDNKHFRIKQFVIVVSNSRYQYCGLQVFESIRKQLYR